MYKELDKYKTGKKSQNFEMNLNVSPNNIQLDEYSFKMGDLINDFIEHKNKPFWKRKHYHNHLTELYIKSLNNIEILTGL